MASESVKLVPEGAGAKDPYVQNAMSKIAVLRSWAAEAKSAEYEELADELEHMLG